MMIRISLDGGHGIHLYRTYSISDNEGADAAHFCPHAIYTCKVLYRVPSVRCRGHDEQQRLATTCFSYPQETGCRVQHAR